MRGYAFGVIAAQILFMAVDEFKYHRKRGLPRWEKWGHPLDMVTVLIPVQLTTRMEWSESALVIYSVLALFSCLFVTKDEWVHTRECEAEENWLHAVLFILHPLVFGAFAWFWYLGERHWANYFTVSALVFGVVNTLYWKDRVQKNV